MVDSWGMNEAAGEGRLVQRNFGKLFVRKDLEYKINFFNY